MPLPRHYAAAVACACLALTATAAQARPHTATATFYSSDRITASGEPFDKTALKAAHRTLPFGSIVKVVNRQTGKSVVVEINDRGPARRTRRAIALTRAAATDIGLQKRGRVPVRLEIAQLTRPQLDQAFRTLVRVTAARDEARRAESAMAMETSAPATPWHVAAAIVTEIGRPIGALGNIFKSYFENLVVPAGP